MGDLTELVCLGVVRDTLHEFGLDKPIPSIMGSRQKLVDCHGVRRGDNLWHGLLAFQACGGWPSGYSKAKSRRIERDCKRAGIRALSVVGELPPLQIERMSTA